MLSEVKRKRLVKGNATMVCASKDKNSMQNYVRKQKLTLMDKKQTTLSNYAA